MKSARSISKTTATLLTPPGRGGIGVIYLSGSEVSRILESIFRPFKSHAGGGEGVLQLGHLVADERVIDEAVVHRRRNAAEINVHGGPQVAKTVLELLGRSGAEIAPAGVGSFNVAHPTWNNPAIGEEMLAALPSARSALVVAALTQQWSGGISRLARTPGAAPVELHAAADGLALTQRLLHPPEVVVAGPPNAGKSTLTNALVGRNVSIVHETPGTTRDWVRELGLFEGVPVWLTDTAGIWDPPEGVDAEAVRRARRCVEQADLILLLNATQIPEWVRRTDAIRVTSKCDICAVDGGADLAVSAVTGKGLAELKNRVLHSFGLDSFDPGVARAFTDRQAARLLEAAQALQRDDPSGAQTAMQKLLEG